MTTSCPTVVLGVPTITPKWSKGLTVITRPEVFGALSSWGCPWQISNSTSAQRKLCNTSEGTSLIRELTSNGKVNDKSYVIERCTEIVLLSATATQSIDAAATTSFDESHPNVAALALAMQTVLAAMGVANGKGNGYGNKNPRVHLAYLKAS